jgi:spermidine synthase
VTLLQRAEELQKASLQQIMLSPSSSSSGSMLERRRIDTVKVKTSTTDASNSQHQHDVQVWQYREVGSKAPIRSLFVNGYLRATATAIAAAPDSLSSMALTSTIAHAEAMIHPAMVAHMAPKRIALWSSTPQPLLREILKHQSVEHVTVLLDDDNNVIKYMNRWFPRFNDCSFRSTANTSTSSANNHNSSRRTTCMDQPGVDVVNHTTVDHWVEGLLDRAPTYTLDEYYKGKATASQGDDCNMTAPWVQPRCHYSRHPQFDIIFIEIPITNSPQQDWLNVNLHQKLLRLLAPESIVILNVGSAPLFLSNSHKYDDEDPSPRDVFLLHAARSVEHGGIGCAATLIYEEVNKTLSESTNQSRVSCALVFITALLITCIFSTFFIVKPLSSPLPTTNIACFAGDSWSYARFVQKHNPASFDLDLIAKVYPVATRKGTKLQKASKSSKPRSVFRNTPTLVYDGPTHVAYLQTPLAWEYWYCRNPILGKSTYACTSFLNQWYNASYHSLSAPSTHVQRLPVKGRALLATQVIPKGHFVLSQDTALSLQIDAVRWYALERFVESFPDAKLYSSLRDVCKYMLQKRGTYLTHGTTTDLQFLKLFVIDLPIYYKNS